MAPQARRPTSHSFGRWRPRTGNDYCEPFRMCPSLSFLVPCSSFPLPLVFHSLSQRNCSLPPFRSLELSPLPELLTLRPFPPRELPRDGTPSLHVSRPARPPIPSARAFQQGSLTPQCEPSNESTNPLYTSLQTRQPFPPRKPAGGIPLPSTRAGLATPRWRLRFFNLFVFEFIQFIQVVQFCQLL